MSVSRQSVFSNMLWRFLERTGAQLVAFIVSIVLARILSVEEFGTIELVVVFINILNVFVDSGLGTSLVQKKDSDNIDFSTVFYTNVVFCIVLYILLFFVSPLIALFYKRPELTPIIRALGLTIVVSGVKNIQKCLNLEFFKKGQKNIYFQKAKKSLIFLINFARLQDCDYLGL